MVGVEEKRREGGREREERKRGEETEENKEKGKAVEGSGSSAVGVRLRRRLSAVSGRGEWESGHWDWAGCNYLTSTSPLKATRAP